MNHQESLPAFRQPVRAFAQVAFPCFLMAALMTQAGCSRGDRPELAKASGKVTLSGGPVAGASVMFQPVDGGRPASAITNDEGIFVLNAFEDAEGVAVGEHFVSVIKIGGDGASALAQAAPAPAETDPNAAPGANLVSPIAFVDEDSAASAPKIEYLVPQKYSNPQNSGLRVTVPSGGTDSLLLELTP